MVGLHKGLFEIFFCLGTERITSLPKKYETDILLRNTHKKTELLTLRCQHHLWSHAHIFSLNDPTEHFTTSEPEKMF